MDWRRLPSDSELHKLALDRICWANMDMTLDDIYDSSSRSIQELDLSFGSMGVTARYGEIDGEVMSAYAHGACALIAYALHKEHGLPLVVWTDEGDRPTNWSGHVAVRVGDDAFLDIRGISTAADVADYYRRYTKALGGPVDMTEAEFLDLIVGDEYKGDVFGYVDRLEHLLTLDYASILVRTYT